MATTISLKKRAPAASKTSAEPARKPLRGAAPRSRPTLAQAQAERVGRKQLSPRDERTAKRDPPQRRKPRAEPAPRSAAPASLPGSVRPAPAPPVGAAQGVRLSKRMSELGLASRREADEWIEQGWVRVDGKVVSTLGARVFANQAISVTPEAHRQQAQRVTVLINKPIGFVSGQAEDGYEPAVVLVTAANQWNADRSGPRFTPSHLRHLAPAGRLDIDSTGLLVLTQDGRIAKLLIGEDSPVEKEYLVRVRCADAALAAQGPASLSLPAERLERLRHGLMLDGEALKPAKVSWQNEEQLRIVLREGKKRQIRRMCELVGLQVTGLKRMRIGRIVLGDLPAGRWRYLGPFERF
jgi:23S rRNA pseudouridine2604 synthase